MTYQTTIQQIKNDQKFRLEICKLLNPSANLKSQWNYMAYDLLRYMARFRDEIKVWIETDYIDKTYRDSFSNYFSTKLLPYDQRCIRLSFTEPDVDYNELLKPDADYNKILNSYLGFMILRPIYCGTVGRTVISPEALVDGSDLKICRVHVRTSFLGLKTTSVGFPHSSQDSEFSTCAETSLWSILYYYGNKYPEYKPIMPSQIHEILEDTAFVRHVPSVGLYPQNISLILKKCGFGCKMYARTNTTSISDRDRLHRIFSCYIESGIPLLLCVNVPYNGLIIGHGIVCIGEKEVDANKLATINSAEFKQYNPTNPLKFKRWLDVPKEYVFNDDNNPCYTIAPFDCCTPQYPSPDPRNIANPTITHIIVPLYSKIYLDAQNAIDLSERLCSRMGLPDNVVLRTYLASGNSYRDFMIRQPNLAPEYKNIFINQICLPKFIWITEIAEESDFIKDKIKGVLILDATQPDPRDSIYPLVRCFNNKFGFSSSNGSEFKEISLNSQFEISRYSNLK